MKKQILILATTTLNLIGMQPAGLLMPPKGQKKIAKTQNLIKTKAKPQLQYHPYILNDKVCLLPVYVYPLQKLQSKSKKTKPVSRGNIRNFLALPDDLQQKIAYHYLQKHQIDLLPFTECRRLTHDRWVLSVADLGNNKIASGSNRGVGVWDLSKPKGERCIDTVADAVHPIAYLDNNKFASLSPDRKMVKVWDLSRPEGDQCTHTLVHEEGTEEDVLSIVSLGNNLIASGSFSYIKVWDLSKPAGQQCIATLYEPAVRMVNLGNGKIAYTYTDNVNIWDRTVPEGEPHILTLTGHTSVVTHITALENNKVASASYDKTIIIWDLSRPAGHRCIATLTGHDREVVSIVSLGDNLIASGDNGNTMKIWDLSRPNGQQCIQTINGPSTRLLSNVGKGRIASFGGSRNINGENIINTDISVWARPVKNANRIFFGLKHPLALLMALQDGDLPKEDKAAITEALTKKNGTVESWLATVDTAFQPTVRKALGIEEITETDIEGGGYA